MPDLSDDLMRELLQSFRAEAAEHLEVLNQALLQLERSEEGKRRKELIQDAFRAAHSLKGAARAVTMNDIESLAYSIESVLQESRKTNIVPEAEVCDVLYEMLDGIQTILDDNEVDVERMQSRLNKILDGNQATDATATEELEAPVVESEPAQPEEPTPPVKPVVQDVRSTTNSSGKNGQQQPVQHPEQEGEDNGFRVVSQDTIRVSVSKLDTLMAQSGELVISKISVEQRLSELQKLREQMSQWSRDWREIQMAVDHLNGSGGQLRELLDSHYERMTDASQLLDRLEQNFHSDTVRLGMMVDDLQADVRRVRMLPVSTITLGLERVVRDASRVEDKQVEFIIEGSEVELDKKILETLKDPLLHLLRNAVSHGIEKPEKRKELGKSAVGTIRFVVRQRGSEVSLSVIDDGRGFDLQGLREASGIDDDSSLDDALSLAFLPGVSTMKSVTALSGRGVGLDVVRQHIEDIHGRIAVDTSVNNGTTIELIVPTSLAITRALMVKVGSERYAIPLLAIERIVEVRNTFFVGGKQMIRVNETPLPLVALASILERSITQDTAHANPTAIIISVAEQRLAVQIDDIVTELELAVKPMGAPMLRVRNVTGAALMGNGLPIVVLNPADLIRSARGVVAPNIHLGSRQDVEVKPNDSILVVDDSITTRTLEKNILEAAGYQVITAINGVEAMNRLEEYPIDLVVTDIEMPHMDGFELTQTIREHNEFSRLPIILVTSLESQEHRERGMMAGADAYIVKRGFNQANLLSTIKQFLDGVE